MGAELMRKLIFFVIAITVAAPSFACSFITAQEFKPSLMTWTQQPGPKQANPNAKGPYWWPVPTPVVHVLKVTRGSVAPGATCGDAGTIDLSVSLPKGAKYSISEFGVYFRVLSGKLPDEIFPSIPLTGPIKNGKMEIFFAWLDGAPRQQIPLNLRVEAFLVTNDLSIGKSTIFSVRAKKGG